MNPVSACRYTRREARQNNQPHIRAPSGTCLFIKKLDKLYHEMPPARDSDTFISQVLGNVLSIGGSE